MVKFTEGRTNIDEPRSELASGTFCVLHCLLSSLYFPHTATKPDRVEFPQEEQVSIPPNPCLPILYPQLCTWGIFYLTNEVKLATQCMWCTVLVVSFCKLFSSECCHRPYPIVEPSRRSKLFLYLVNHMLQYCLPVGFFMYVLVRWRLPQIVIQS